MKAILLLIIIECCPLFSQTQEGSVTVKATYTTGTQFTYNINRSQYFDDTRVLGSNFGYGADIRWKILWERFYFGVSFEKIESSETSQVLLQDQDYISVPYTEGFQLSALELTGYYVVPISSDNIQFYLGGGIGLYDGDRSNSIATATSATTNTTSDIGIHVLTGVDYRIASRLALRGELKFRDPHFDVTSKFDTPSVTYLGRTIYLDESETTTSVNLYGVNYVLGLVFIL